MSLNEPAHNFLGGDLLFGGSFARSKELEGRSLHEIRTIYASESDAQLAIAFIAGKGDAFAALVDRHASMVYHFVYRYLQNADNTNDVVQDVFIKVWKNIKKFDTSKNFKTWLLTIAKNTSLDFIKKKKPVLFSHIEAEDADLDAFLIPFM